MNALYKQCKNETQLVQTSLFILLFNTLFKQYCHLVKEDTVLTK